MSTGEKRELQEEMSRAYINYNGGSIDGFKVSWAASGIANTQIWQCVAEEIMIEFLFVVNVGDHWHIQ